MASTNKQPLSKAEEVIKKMSEGICHFTYRKKDGELREAFGTLNSDLIPSKWLPMLHALKEDVMSHPWDNAQKALSFGKDLQDKLKEFEELLEGKKKAPKGAGDGYVNYYDLGKKSWGKFSPENIEFVFDSFWNQKS